MSIIHQIGVGSFVLAGLIFGAASVINMRKGQSNDSFKCAMCALGALLVAAIIA